MCNSRVRIVEVTGGLGNQMFQYAFGKYLEYIYPEDAVKYDIGYYDAQNAIRMYSLKNAFDIEIPVADKNDIRRIRGYNAYDNKVERVLNGIIKSVRPTDGIEIVENLDGGFEGNNIASTNNSYYSGYWQSEKYIKDHRSGIESCFSFNLNNATDDFWQMNSKVANCNAIALHVRLEDYLNEENLNVYGNICTADYYAKSIDYITSEYDDAVFFVFSTDVVAAIELLPIGHNYVPVTYDGQKDYLDMYLMTKCKHNIIANSTFSWWGAWLNTNTQKKVVCPTRWFNNHDIYNQYCEGWIKI